MSEKTMKENLQSFAAKQILHYLDEDPEKSLPKLLEWADKFDKDNTLPSIAHRVRPPGEGRRRAQLQHPLGHFDGPHLRLQPALHRLLGRGIRQQAEHEL